MTQLNYKLDRNMTEEEIQEKILNGLPEEVYEKIEFLENNTIDKIKANMERYGLAKLLRSKEELSVAMKKLTEEVITLKFFIKSLIKSDNYTKTEPNDNHFFETADHGNMNGNWNNYNCYNNCLPNLDFGNNNNNLNNNGYGN